MAVIFTEGYFRWRARRGMKELDFMLNQFIDQQFNLLTQNELTDFNAFLQNQDTDLWYWLSGKTEPSDKHMQLLVKKICAASYDKK